VIPRWVGFIGGRVGVSEASAASPSPVICRCVQCPTSNELQGLNTGVCQSFSTFQWRHRYCNRAVLLCQCLCLLMCNNTYWRCPTFYIDVKQLPSFVILKRWDGQYHVDPVQHSCLSSRSPSVCRMLRVEAPPPERPFCLNCKCEPILLFNMMQPVCMVNYFVDKRQCLYCHRSVCIP